MRQNPNIRETEDCGAQKAKPRLQLRETVSLSHNKGPLRRLHHLIASRQRNKDVELNERQRKVISRMLMGWEGRMTNKKYAGLTDCSDATATRDLGDLVAKGILRTDSAGGRSTSYELVAAD